MYSDFHLHTHFSGDSDTPPRLQVEQAIRLGMSEICITDHHDYDVDSGDLDFTLDFERYFPAMNALREEYAGLIDIRIGIELGLQRHISSYLDELVSKYRKEVDFIIGSNHFVDGLDPYFPVFFAGRTEQQAYCRFFEVTLSRIKRLDRHCFHVLGHLDYAVRYGPNQNRYYDFNAYREYIEPILKTLIENGQGLECNTGGLKYGLGHPHPTEEILTRYRELGGEILTLGSDAHAPEHVGYGFSRLKELLIHCGFSYYTTFKEQKPVFHPF